MTEKPQSSRFLPAMPMGLALLVLAWLACRLAGGDPAVHSLPGTAASRVEWCVVSAGSRTVEQMEHPDGWIPWPGGCPLRAGPGEELWVRLTLRNPNRAELRGVLANSMGYLDEAYCYTRDEGGWQVGISGEWTPPDQRALWGRDTAFPISVPPGGERTVYLRQRDALMVYLIPVWWPDQAAFHVWQMRHLLAEGLYFGTVLALLFYNAVLWARLRFPDTGPYLLYLVFLAVFMLVSRGDMAFFGLALGSPVMEMVVSGALVLSGVFLLEFAGRFLSLSDRAPRAASFLRWTQGFLLALAVCVLATPWVPRVMGLVWCGVGVAHLLLLGIALAAWKRGARSARYLVLGFGLLFSGLVPILAGLAEFVPIDESGVVMMTGSAVEMLLLSLAVAYRYAGLQREKIAAQRALLAEGEQRRVLQEAYADELALEVFERTRDLQGAVADKDRMIAILAHDLCSPLAGITHRAEQLAAGADPQAMAVFTREAAAMGRQMLTLAGDLVSWSHARGGVTTMTPHPARAVAEPMLALHREAAARRRITVTAALPEGVEVLTDLVQAQTLLRNLLSNAIKFATREVHVTADIVGEGVRFAVADDGPGLPPAVAAGLSGGETDHFTAAGGLGLRLCREIARSLGLQLRAASTDGGGTEISFILKQAEVRETTPAP